MADVDTAPERKQRKSVAFSEGATVVDEDGNVKEVIDDGVEKNTAESHTASTGTTNGDAGVDEVTDMMATLAKKKKKSKKAKDDEAGENAAEGDGDLELSALKKKEEEKSKPADTDDFEAKLKEFGGAEKEGEDGAAAEEDTGDMMKGTGIWEHDATAPIKYNGMLSRFFTMLHAHHPDLAGSGSKNYKIPPPQCLREGNKKTIFANLNEICRRMKRTDEHVIQFLFAELGTNGSVDGSRRLVIKGRFQQKQIENVLRRYIVEYVTCKTCRSPDTSLSKGENRLYFVSCNSCGSRRSVTAIKHGFTAQVGKRRRQQG